MTHGMQKRNVSKRETPRRRLITRNDGVRDLRDGSCCPSGSDQLTYLDTHDLQATECSCIFYYTAC